MKQMVIGLRDIHNVGLIHRDIKPANFSIGRINKKKIYIFDFGLASEFNTGPEKATVGFRGTNTYASIRVHQYKDPGRVDDLWSLLYCILRLLGMKFPWDKVKIPPKAERCGSKTIRDMYVRLQRDSGNGDARLPSKNTMIQKLKQERKLSRMIS
jgi:tau tubulin kinase